MSSLEKLYELEKEDKILKEELAKFECWLYLIRAQIFEKKGTNAGNNV